MTSTQHVRRHGRLTRWAMTWQMNTRGLVELIVLNVGLEAKVISPKLFTIMVLMVRPRYVDHISAQRQAQQLTR